MALVALHARRVVLCEWLRSWARTPPDGAAHRHALGAALWLEIGDRIDVIIVALGIIVVRYCHASSRWAALGACYAFAASIASVRVRLDSLGFHALIFVLLVVWVTISAISVVGARRTELWPVSPKKNWPAQSGLCIALRCRRICSFGRRIFRAVVAAGAVLSIVATADSSNPHHGVSGQGFRTSFPARRRRTASTVRGRYRAAAFRIFAGRADGVRRLYGLVKI